MNLVRRLTAHRAMGEAPRVTAAWIGSGAVRGRMAPHGSAAARKGATRGLPVASLVPCTAAQAAALFRMHPRTFPLPMTQVQNCLHCRVHFPRPSLDVAHFNGLQRLDGPHKR